MDHLMDHDSPSNGAVAPPCPAWARGLTVGLSLALADAAVAATTHHSAWHAAHLDASIRWTAMGCAALCAIAVSTLLVTPLAALVDFSRAHFRMVGRTLATLLVVILATLAGGYYMASWNSLRTTGEFLNQHSIRLALVNPREVWLHAIHMSPWATFAGPLLAFVFGVWTAWVSAGGCPARAVGAVVTSRRGRLVGATIATGLLTMGLAAATDHRSTVDPDTGLLVTRAQRFAWSWRHHSSPVAHAASQWQRWLSGAADVEQLWERAGVFDVALEGHLLRRRQIPLADYASRIPPEARHWNVIVILVESLRPDQLQQFGGSRLVMPHVERLSQRSLCFRRTYTQASHSSYADLCPLNSHYPLRSTNIHFYPRNAPYPRVLFYDVLKALGYRTAVISSQDERWGQMDRYLRKRSLDDFLHAGNFAGSLYVDSRDRGFAAWASAGKRSGKIDDAETIGRAIEWIDRRPQQPFALYLNLQNSHVPYVIPESYHRKYSPAKLDFEIGFNSFPPERAEEVKDVYADALGYVDQQLGRLFQYLEKTGALKRSVIVLTGDTGQAFYEHGFAAHANRLYDEVMRVPLVIYAPRVKARVDDQLAQHVDILPTVWSLLGLPAHPSFQGRNLLAPPVESPAAYLLVQTPLAFQVAIVKDRWKLILDLPTSNYLLFDLQSDPGERNNLAQHMPDVVEELAEQLKRWCRAQLDYYRDPWRMATEYPPVLDERSP